MSINGTANGRRPSNLAPLRQPTSPWVPKPGRIRRMAPALERAAIVILLTWFLLSAYVVIFGAELNGQIEHQTAKDTTTGSPQPLGRRGARYADTVGDTP